MARRSGVEVAIVGAGAPSGTLSGERLSKVVPTGLVRRPQQTILQADWVIILVSVPTHAAFYSLISVIETPIKSRT